MRQGRTVAPLAAMVFTTAAFTGGCAVEPTRRSVEPASVATPRAAQPLHPELVEILAERHPEMAETEALEHVPADVRRKLLLETLGSVLGHEFAGGSYDAARDVQHLSITSDRAATTAASLADRYQVVVEIQRVQYGDNELRAVWESLLAGASPGIPAVTIRTGSMDIDTEHNRVEVTLFYSAEAHTIAAKIRSTYGDIVTVEVARPSSPPTAGPDGLLPPVSVEDTLAWAKAGISARVRDGLISDRDGTVLCGSWQDSDPPSCDEPRIRVVGVPTGQLHLSEKDGVHYGQVDVVVRFTSADEARFLKQVVPEINDLRFPQAAAARSRR